MSSPHSHNAAPQQLAHTPTTGSRWTVALREVESWSRLLVGGLFVWSASAHLANPYYFLSSVYQYELTNASVGVIVASGLPFLELLLAACLLGGACVPAAWVISCGLLLLFAGVQTSALMRNLQISCGCFGAEASQPISAMTTAWTGMLAIVAGAGAAISRDRSGTTSPKP